MVISFTLSSMVFCIRKPVFAGTDPNVDGIGQEIAALGVPVEIGLPFNFSEFMAVAKWLPILAHEIVEHSVTCIAVHAPEGDVITRYSDTFLKSTADLSHFANQVGAKTIVFHPKEEPSVPHGECLDLLVKNITALQQTTGAVITVETFRSRKWIRYKEVITAGLPVCLDTSHLSHGDTLEVLDRHLDQVQHVHLSERKPGGVHLPVGEFGMQVLDRLARARWTGPVCLEYMDEYSAQAVEDCAELSNKFSMYYSMP